jgi:hypothetical protein
MTTQEAAQEPTSTVTALTPRDRKARPRTDIVGWGADLDPSDRPAVPMERMPPRLDGIHWDQPEQQPVRTTIFHSTERPGITPVFGTAQPPTGVSGRIRHWAYKHSENDLRHWLLLLLADRVNVVEGIGQDLRRGHMPNLFAEMGGRAAWKHDPMGVVVKGVAVGLVTGFLLVKLLRRRR